MASDAYAPTAPPRTPGATSTPAGAEQRNDGYGVTWPRVLHSEWAKLWSLRSTWISLIATCVVTVVLGMAVAGTYESGSADSDVGPVELTLLGTQFGQIMIAVLGVLVTAGEYATGMIRATFAAVPRRLPVLWAKATVFGAVAFAVMLVTVFLTFPLAQGFLSGTDMEAGLGDPGVVRALCGAAAGIALSGVLCLGFGALLRGVPAAIGAYIGAVLVLPEVAGLLPYGAVDDITAYLPSKATYALMATHHGPDLLAPGPALLAMGCWVAVTLAAAALLIKRRDV
ncbi:ABC transporter permease [Streptomyces zagrosensis]|uniref:ABC-type transport system involved in multi-copper enzyme maturation permease subunit n=1 Tax=Streptomyces zagrosensis TaxID=1042984 RepID=A0A7W9QHL3_9ACTN|nr:ABC transporter permease [Streptomyces zagrosensis]MBB5939112.1 ABC-type transport system involved in multi-copper enzyme maturation permease subunit [Streptomyces zagrosensis]